MVYEDLFSRRPDNKNSASEPHLLLEQIAAPVDRLAAFVGEMPVFVPLLSVLLAPFKHDISIAQFMGSQTQVALSVTEMLITSFVGFIAYQTLFVYFFGATPGKYFVGLRVVSVFAGKKPSFTMCLLRSLSIVFEFMLLGFPWLSAISHPQRRVLHDRLSDTYVKCLDRKKAVFAPLFVEKQLARNVQAPGWAFLLLAVAIFFNFVSSERRDLKLVKEYESVEQLCQPVTDAYQNWHSDIDPDPSRVAVALALYESQNIDDACLEKEAHFSLWRNQDKDLGYLALGLSLSNEDKKFSEYIDKVCKTDKGGEVCQFAMAVEAERSGVAVDLRLPASLEHGSGLSQMPEVHRDFIRLHIERQLHEHNQLSAALEVIEKSAATPNFADYLNLERLKIMWEMDRMLEARAAFQASRAHETGASRLQLSSWMCSAEVLSGCKNESKSACADFVADYDQLDNEPQSELVELNYIRAQKCVSAESLDYVNVGKKLFSDHAHDYLTALELVEDRKYGGARKLFKHIADQAESEEFQFQATADLVKLASTKIELDYFFEEFLSKDNLRAEPNFAFELFNKYLTLGDFDKVAAVGESLIKAFPYKTSLYTTLLKEAKKHKRVKFAQKIRLQFKKMMPLSTALESEKL